MSDNKPSIRRASALSFLTCITVIAGIVLSTSAQRAQAGTLTTLYSFAGGADGANPIGGVTMDTGGTLYGETYIGGTTNCTSHYQPPRSGCGTIYSFNSQTGFKTLATFTGPNGAYGATTPTLQGATLYGTTTAGGASDDGIIYSVNTDGTNFKILHQFAGTDGKYPSVTLLPGKNGVLYGITPAGGASNDGVIYSITSSGTFTLLHSFTGGKGGRAPDAMLISPAGDLIGSTLDGGQTNKYCSLGCGTIFAYSQRSGLFRDGYKFSDQNLVVGTIGSIGSGPTAYGENYDEIYALNRAGTVTILATISQVDAGNVGAGPILTPTGSLTGVIGAGPISAGTLYSISYGVFNNLAFFGSNGTNPLAQPIVTSTGTVIGTASQNGLCAGCGTIWQYTP